MHARLALRAEPCLKSINVMGTKDSRAVDPVACPGQVGKEAWQLVGACLERRPYHDGAARTRLLEHAQVTCERQVARPQAREHTETLAAIYGMNNKHSTEKLRPSLDLMPRRITHADSRGS